VQRGERQLELGLHSRQPHDSKVAGVVCGVVKQRGFADSGLASDHQDDTLPVEHGAESEI
jgi:hypothetical protein